ncbi:hypothetical protein GGE65_003247 [Skermanella aerolata]|jgi:hypothetical protein|uniref:Uncharacterized protein n=1 Tax=Skermanella aerolata TaxID=393310 RepID=A0A512DSN9_9PROT|nr:hypothetical protein [Skermanella aerolata]KJB96168.1 hypothetical protein N826_37965 [Skermanella aerolata KACC 11604]GEO39492.1 hypothetical protein SAE02_36400 [Skermanella aerolata]
MNEVAQPVFLIVGATGEHGAVDHTIVEMPSRSAGDIVGQALSARLMNGGAVGKAYFQVVSPSA